MQANIFKILVNRAQVTDVTVTHETQEINWLNNTWKNWLYDDYYQYEVGSYGWENTNFSPLFVQSFSGANQNGDFAIWEKALMRSPAPSPILSSTLLDLTNSNAWGLFLHPDNWISLMYSVDNSGLIHEAGSLNDPFVNNNLQDIIDNVWSDAETYPFVTSNNFTGMTTNDYPYKGLSYVRPSSMTNYDNFILSLRYEDNFSATDNANNPYSQYNNNNIAYPNFITLLYNTTAVGGKFALDPKWNKIAAWDAFNFYNKQMAVGYSSCKRAWYMKVDSSTAVDNTWVTNTGKSWHYLNVDSVLDLYLNTDNILNGSDSNFYFYDNVVNENGRLTESTNEGPQAFNRYNPVIAQVTAFNKITQPNDDNEFILDNVGEMATVTLSLNFYKTEEDGSQWAPVDLSPYTLLNGWTQNGSTNFPPSHPSNTGAFGMFEPLERQYFNGEGFVTQSLANMNSSFSQGGVQYMQVQPGQGVQAQTNKMAIRMRIDILFQVHYHMYIKFKMNVANKGGYIYFTQNRSTDWEVAIADRGTQWIKFGGDQYADEHIQFDFIAENHLVTNGDGYIIIVWEEGATLSQIWEMQIQEQGLGWRMGTQAYHYKQLADGASNSAFGKRPHTTVDSTIGRLGLHPLVLTTRRTRKDTINDYYWEVDSNSFFGGNILEGTHDDFGQSSGYGMSFYQANTYHFAERSEWAQLTNPNGYDNNYNWGSGSNNDLWTVTLYPVDFQPKDNKGFYINKHKDFDFTIAVGSRSLSMFAQNSSINTLSTKMYKHVACNQSGAIEMNSLNQAGDAVGELLTVCREETGFDNMSFFRLGYIKFHTNEFSHITKDPQGTNKARLYYDPTRTKTPKPRLVKRVPVVEEGESGWCNFTISISSIVYASSAAQSAQQKDTLRIRGLDENENIIWNITASTTTGQTYTQYVNLGQTKMLEITPSGDTGYGLDALIDTAGFAINEPNLQVLQTPSGSNQDCLVYANNPGVVDSSWTVTTADGTTSSAGLPSISAALDLLLYDSDPAANMIPVVIAAQIVSIYVDVQMIHADTTITVTDYLTGTALTHDITSVGITTIDRTIPSNLYGLGSIILEFSHDNANTTLECQVRKVWIEAKNPTTYFGYESVQHDIDLFTDTEPFALNLNSKNYEVLDSLNGDYTKTVKVPATKNNLKAFDSQDQITAVYSDQFFQGIGAQAYVDGLEVFRGSAFLDNVQYDEYGEQSLELLFKGGNNNWAQLLDTNRAHLRNLFVNDNVDGTQLTPDNIMLANLFTASHVVFPLVDVGRWHDTNQGEWDDEEEILAITVDHLRPSYKINRVMDKAFESIGWSFESEVLKENAEFAGFGPDFQNQYVRLIGTPAEARVHEDAINNSLILLETSNIQKTRSHPMFGNAPHMRAIRLPAGPNQVAVVTQRALAFETEHRDDAAQHVVRNVAASEVQNWGSAGGEFTQGELDGQPSGYAPNFFNDNTQGAGSIQPKSFITVNKSGYYRITANMVVNMYTGVGSGVEYVWPPLRFASLGLAPVYGNIDSTFTDRGMGILFCTNMQTLSDANQNNKQEIQPDDTLYINDLGGNYNVAMSRNVNLGYDCYLKAGHQYAIFYFDGALYNDALGGIYSRGFSEVVGCELEIKLSKEIAPLFNWGLIYPGNGGTFEAIPKVKMEHILPDVTPIEFVSEISKLYNLVWQSNPHTKVAECEPFHYFYDWNGVRHPYYDWNDKAVIIKTEKDSLLSTNVYYKFVNDGSDRTLQKGMTENSILFGDVLFETNRNKDKEVKDVSLKFLSTCKMHWEKNLAHNQVSGGVSRLAIWTPNIYSEDTYGFMRNHRKPDVNGSHEHKLLQYLGTKELGEHEITYNLVKRIDSGDPDNHYYQNQNLIVYGHAVSYEPGSDNLPATFSKSNTQNSEAQGGFFNRFHQSQIEMFKDRDELITALVYLSPSDVAQINYRRLVVIGNERYIISRIKDYNPANAEPTEVELVLVSDRGSKERLTH